MLSYSHKNPESQRLQKRINSAHVPGVTLSTGTMCIGMPKLCGHCWASQWAMHLPSCTSHIRGPHWVLKEKATLLENTRAVHLSLDPFGDILELKTQTKWLFNVKQVLHDSPGPPHCPNILSVQSYCCNAHETLSYFQDQVETAEVTLLTWRWLRYTLVPVPC